jgi:hypothetical protein
MPPLKWARNLRNNLASTFHQHVHGVPEDSDGSDEHQNWEDEGTNRIDDDQVRIEVNHQSGNKNSQTLQKRKLLSLIITIKTSKKYILKVHHVYK